MTTLSFTTADGAKVATFTATSKFRLTIATNNPALIQIRVKDPDATRYADGIIFRGVKDVSETIDTGAYSTDVKIIVSGSEIVEAGYNYVD